MPIQSNLRKRTSLFYVGEQRRKRESYETGILGDWLYKGS